MTTFRRPGSFFAAGAETIRMRPWHSVRETDRKVYHDDARCVEGAGVDPQHRREGTEGRRKCEECQGYSSA